MERLSICCAFNPDEEIGSTSSHEWLASIGARSKCALIVECARAGGELVRSRKGVADLKVVFRGRSAHAGNNPQDGANANVAAMRFSLACYELADPSKGTTVNPGIIAGGTATNVIPDSCEVRFDLRYCFDKDGSDLENQIFELAERSWAPGVSQTVELLGFTPAMPLSDDAKALTAKSRKPRR